MRYICARAACEPRATHGRLAHSRLVRTYGTSLRAHAGGGAQQAAHTGNQLRLIARDGGAAATPAREQSIVTEAHARAPNCSGSTGRPVGTQLGPRFLRNARDTRNKGEQYFLLQNKLKEMYQWN